MEVTYLRSQESVEELCVGRPSDEFFRLTTEGTKADMNFLYFFCIFFQIQLAITI